MQIIGNTCPVCEKVFEQGEDVVVCPVCGTPHHRECWQKNGECINSAKHSEGFVWESAVAEEKPVYKSEDYKICPVCGEKNAKYEPVCLKCGERLRGNNKTIDETIGFPFGKRADYSQNVNPNNFSPYQNMYAQDAKTVFGDDKTVSGIPVSEVAEFVQKDCVKYVGKFIEMEEKNTKFSWNWSAAIGSFFWCFYRKMTAVGITLFLLLFAAYTTSSYVPNIIYRNFQPVTYEEYSDVLDDLTTDMENSLKSGKISDSYYTNLRKLITSPITLTSYVMFAALAIIIFVTFGFFGDYYYKKKVIKDIEMLRRMSNDSVSYHIFLKQRGGVSMANVLLPILGYFVISMFSGFFA